MNLDLFINTTCNFRCEYCTVDLDNVFMEFKELNDIRFENYNVINVLGGEPLLHPELEEILNYISARNKNIILYTNGSKLIGNDYDFPEFLNHYKIVFSIHYQLISLLEKKNFRSKDEFINIINKENIIRTQVVFNFKNKKTIDFLLENLTSEDLSQKIFLCSDIEDSKYYSSTFNLLKKVYQKNKNFDNIFDLSLINLDISSSDNDYVSENHAKFPKREIIYEKLDPDFCSLKKLFEI